jgi:hypothetical protein
MTDADQKTAAKHLRVALAPSPNFKRVLHGELGADFYVRGVRGRVLEELLGPADRADHDAGLIAAYDAFAMLSEHDARDLDSARRFERSLETRSRALHRWQVLLRIALLSLGVACVATAITRSGWAMLLVVGVVCGLLGAVVSERSGRVDRDRVDATANGRSMSPDSDSPGPRAAIATHDFAEPALTTRFRRSPAARRSRGNALRL